MAPFYKHFYRVRTVFTACFLCFFLWMPGAWAADDLYTVEGVAVDATADNALQARDKAFGQAQQQAFMILAGRMLPEAEAQKLTPPDPLAISPLIQDFEVTQEQLSAVRYVGTYTFRFKQAAVSQYFGQSGTDYTAIESPPLLLLPFFQPPDGPIVLWAQQNPWRQAWDRMEGQETLVPIVVPLGDLDDVKDVSDQEAFTYRNENMARLLGRYHSAEAVLAVAAPDATLAAAGDGPLPPGATLAVEQVR